VDNLTITVNNEKLLETTKNNIKGEFNMKDLGEIYWLLNIRINRDRTMKTISLWQDTYCNNPAWVQSPSLCTNTT
jgi:hypothetical protein